MRCRKNEFQKVRLVNGKPTSEIFSFACDHCRKQSPSADSECEALIRARMHGFEIVATDSNRTTIFVCAVCRPLYVSRKDSFSS